MSTNKRGLTVAEAIELAMTAATRNYIKQGQKIWAYTLTDDENNKPVIFSTEIMGKLYYYTKKENSNGNG